MGRRAGWALCKSRTGRLTKHVNTSLWLTSSRLHTLNTAERWKRNIKFFPSPQGKLILKNKARHIGGKYAWYYTLKRQSVSSLKETLFSSPFSYRSHIYKKYPQGCKEPQRITECKTRVRYFAEIHSQSSNEQHSSHFGQFLLITATFLTISDGAVDDVEASSFNPGICTVQTNQCYRHYKLSSSCTRILKLLKIEKKLHSSHIL